MITFDQIRRDGTGIRVHGNGFIQIDLPDNKRVNVWGHSAIPRQNVATQLHDHRFDFYSFVLRGTLVNATYRVAKSRSLDASHNVYTPIARAGEDTELVLVGDPVRLFPNLAAVIMEGDSYRMKAGDIHETFVNQPTATLMLKGDVYSNAVRVFCPVGRQPDNEFVRDQVLFEDEMWDITKEVFAQ